jgi:hypothetical protein
LGIGCFNIQQVLQVISLLLTQKSMADRGMDLVMQQASDEDELLMQQLNALIDLL